MISVAVGGTTTRTANFVTNGSFEAGKGSFQSWTISGTNGSGPGVDHQTDGVTAGLYGDVIKADPFTSSPDASGTHAAHFADHNAAEQLREVVVKVPEPPSVPILALALGLLGLVRHRCRSGV